MSLEPINISDIKFDCLHFKGAIPCKPNKLRNRVCKNCVEYTPISKRILIIKLGALGDVIRTTPLVTRFKELYPNCHITWLTQSPDILPSSKIDEIHKFDFTSSYIVRNRKFDIAINLDKEIEACSLLKDVRSDEKYGFTLNDYHIDAANDFANHKLITGFFDNYSQENTKHYLDEIFEICGLKYNGEEYLLDVDPKMLDKWLTEFSRKSNDKKIIGLNTGCGNRWPTRLWPKEKWVELINLLTDAGYYPVVLGGPDEDELNKYYANETGAFYPGLHSLKEFIAIAAACNLIVTAVSMMMHIAMGTKRHLILFNNIFNKHEFYMFDRGEIVEPIDGCECFYGNICKRDVHCMNSVDSKNVFEAIVRNLH